MILFVVRPFVVDYLHLLKNQFEAGPPKRLAQVMGLSFMLAGTLFRFAIFPSDPQVAYWILSALWIASALLASYDLCLACALFAVLMRLGLVPESICVECRIHFEVEDETADEPQPLAKQLKPPTAKVKPTPFAAP